MQEAAGVDRRLLYILLRKDSDCADVLGLFTLAAWGHVELDLLTFVERLVSVTLDVGVVDEHIVATFTRDKAEALLAVKEFYRSLCQNNSFRYWRALVARPSDKDTPEIRIPLAHHHAGAG